MDRIQLISQAGKDILILDLSNCPIPEGLQVLERAKPLIRTRPPQSLLVLTDITGSRYDSEWASAIKDFANGNKPFVRASAVVGVTGLGRILMMGVASFTGRVFKTFDDREPALAWLARQ